MSDGDLLLLLEKKQRENIEYAVMNQWAARSARVAISKIESIILERKNHFK